MSIMVIWPLFSRFWPPHPARHYTPKLYHEDGHRVHTAIPPFYIMNPILILIPSWNKPKPPPRTTTSPRRQRRPVVPHPSQPQVPRVLSHPLHWNRSSGWRPFLPKRSYTPGSVAATNRVMMMMIMVASIQGMMIPKPRLPKTRVVNESATPRWKPISVVVPLQNYTATDRM